MSGPASASISAAGGNRSASWSATRSNWACTAAESGWAKIERTSVATNGPADFGTRVSRFRRKWALQTLPRRSGKGGGDRVAEAGVSIGDHQADPGKAAGDQAAQERGPARPILGGVQVKAQDLPGSGRVDLHTSEDGAGWTAFLRGLVARALAGVRLV